MKRSARKIVIANPRLSRKPFRIWCTADAPSIICVAKSWTAARSHGAAGWGWAAAGTLQWRSCIRWNENWVRLHLRGVRAQSVTGCACTVCPLLQKEGDERSHRRRQSAGLEAANVFPSQISSSYGLFCKAPQVKNKKWTQKKEQIREPLTAIYDPGLDFASSTVQSVTGDNQENDNQH